MSQKGQEFVCSGALCRCDKGTLPMPLLVTTNASVLLQGKPLASNQDKTFPPFGTCLMKNNLPCTPALLLWEGAFAKLNMLQPGRHPLLANSTIKCLSGGTVSILTTLQLAIPGLPAPPQAEATRTDTMSLCPALV
jgi:hypothetical protein